MSRAARRIFVTASINPRNDGFIESIPKCIDKPRYTIERRNLRQEDEAAGYDPSLHMRILKRRSYPS